MSLDLPNEIWEVILSYLSQRNHSILRQTCKLFNSLSKNLIRNIPITSNKELKIACIEGRWLDIIPIY